MIRSNASDMPPEAGTRAAHSWKGFLTGRKSAGRCVQQDIWFSPITRHAGFPWHPGVAEDVAPDWGQLILGVLAALCPLVTARLNSLAHMSHLEVALESSAFREVQSQDGVLASKASLRVTHDKVYWRMSGVNLFPAPCVSAFKPSEIE